MTTKLPKVLYVEDDPQQRSLMKALLELYGLEVTTAESAQDALQLMTDGSFEMVLIDYDLPDMTGAHLAREIRGIRPSTPIILFSGRVFLPPGELVYVDAFLVKGCSVDELLCTMASVAPLPSILGCLKFLSGHPDRKTFESKLSEKLA